MAPVVLALVASSICLNAIAQIALRKTMLGIGSPPAGGAALLSYALSIGLSPSFIVGLSCYAISLCVWLMVLARVEVSLAYPLSSIGFLITAAVAHFYLGESVGLMRLSGIALICLGILVVSRSA